MRQPGDDAAADHLGRPGRSAWRPAAARSIRATRRGASVSSSGDRAPPRWRSQPKPCSSRAQAGLGGSIANGERPSQMHDGPARPKLPGCDLVGEARILRPQVGRRQQQLLGSRRRDAASAAAASGACAPARPAAPARTAERRQPDLSRAQRPWTARSRVRRRVTRCSCFGALRNVSMLPLSGPAVVAPRPASRQGCG